MSITVSWSSAFPNRFLTVDHRSVSALSPLPPLRCTSGSDIYSRYSTLRSCARLRPVDRHPPALALHSESKHASLSRGRTTNTPGSLCLARGYELIIEQWRFTPITHAPGVYRGRMHVLMSVPAEGRAHPVARVGCCPPLHLPGALPDPWVGMGLEWGRRVYDAPSTRSHVLSSVRNDIRISIVEKKD